MAAGALGSESAPSSRARIVMAGHGLFGSDQPGNDQGGDADQQKGRQRLAAADGENMPGNGAHLAQFHMFSDTEGDEL